MVEVVEVLCNVKASCGRVALIWVYDESVYVLQLIAKIYPKNPKRLNLGILSVGYCERY